VKQGLFAERKDIFLSLDFKVVLKIPLSGVEFGILALPGASVEKKSRFLKIKQIRLWMHAYGKPN